MASSFRMAAIGGKVKAIYDDGDGREYTIVDCEKRYLRGDSLCQTHVVEVHRGDGWTIVGQYPSRRQAEMIAEDYRSRGETVRAIRGS